MEMNGTTDTPGNSKPGSRRVVQGVNEGRKGNDDKEDSERLGNKITKEKKGQHFTSSYLGGPGHRGS